MSVRILLIPITTLAIALPVHYDAAAQAEIVPEDSIEGASDKDTVGWNPSLGVSGTLNIVDNTNVVGQVEGTSLLLGLGMVGGADYVKGKMLVRNELTINEGFARTPVIDKFVKTNDVVTLSSTYNYFLTKKLGVFGRGKIATSLFRARALTADPVTYTIKSGDANGMDRQVTSDKIKVASPFKPLTLTYSAGGFAEPVNRKQINLRVRAGLGGRHTFASGVLVQNDDDSTPNVELQELVDVHQAGFEVFAGLDGKAKKDRLKYTLGASLLIPFLNNDEFDRSATELMRVAVEASATMAVYDWLGIVYKATIAVDPQLFPKDEELTQFQNSLLLTFQYTLIDRKKSAAQKKKEAEEAAAKKDKAEQLEKAKLDKDEAERKTAEAERKEREAQERIKELEQALENAKKPADPPPPAPDPAVTP